MEMWKMGKRRANRVKVGTVGKIRKKNRRNGVHFHWCCLRVAAAFVIATARPFALFYQELNALPFWSRMNIRMQCPLYYDEDGLPFFGFCCCCVGSSKIRYYICKVGSFRQAKGWHGSCDVIAVVQLYQHLCTRMRK